MENERIKYADISQQKWEEHREPTDREVTSQRITAFHTSVPRRVEGAHCGSAVNGNYMI